MSLKFDNFTQKSKEAIVAARNIAHKNEHQSLAPEHLLAALLENQSSIVYTALSRLTTIPTLLLEINRLINKHPKVKGSGNDVYFADSTLSAFKGAEAYARSLNEKEVAHDHLLIGLLDHSTALSDLFNSLNIRTKRVMEVLQELRGGSKPTQQAAPTTSTATNAAPVNQETNTPLLDKYARDLTRLAREDKLDPVVGREEEMRRIIQVLTRRTKNNPILIGDPGIGKNAIITGIARRLANNDAPQSLHGTRLAALDMAALVAGAKLRGEFEERLKGVVKEVQNSNGQIILSIDEIHSISGNNKESAGDAASLLKPALARGEIRCIGVTTAEEYKKYIESDPALARRFQAIWIEEPTVEQTVAILRGIKPKYEIHHGVQITDAALIAAAQLSTRYITDRNLPDKAIDLIDEAASQLRMTIDGVPAEIDQAEREVVRWEMEYVALAREIDRDSIEKRTELKKKIETAKENAKNLRSKWNSELDTLKKIRIAKKELNQVKKTQQEYENAGNLEKAAEIKYGKLPILEKNISKLEESMADLHKNNGKTFIDSVQPGDIAFVISQATGIPTAKMLASEKRKLVAMESQLREKVVGQDHVLKSISDAVRLSRAGVQDGGRPIGSFLFLGTSGVGKTETAKALAEFLFDDPNAMIRFDMSEYMEKHAATRLIGAPPGYVGYDEGGQLTDAVRRRPYSVVLFDEVEKAHADVFNLLLALLDDGRLTDSKGRTVDFSNTIVILTSNLGSRDIIDLGPEHEDEAIVKVKAAVKAHFRPEFLNRIDEQIVFRMLSKDRMIGILEILLKKLQKNLAEQKISIKVSDNAKAFIVDAGFNPAYGARPLKRAVLSLIQKPLSMHILSGDFQEGDTVNIDTNSDKTELTFTKI